MLSSDGKRGGWQNRGSATSLDPVSAEFDHSQNSVYTSLIFSLTFLISVLYDITQSELSTRSSITVSWRQRIKSQQSEVSR